MEKFENCGCSFSLCWDGVTVSGAEAGKVGWD